MRIISKSVYEILKKYSTFDSKKNRSIIQMVAERNSWKYAKQKTINIFPPAKCELNRQRAALNVKIHLVVRC